MQELQASPAAISFIKSKEGFETNAYRCPAGVWTIGYGFTKGVKKGDMMTRQDADVRMSVEVDEFEHGLRKLLGAAPTTQGQFDALLSFAFNLGLGALRTSSLLRFHKDGDYRAAEREFAKWVNVRDPQTKQLKRVRGLVSRRAEEAKAYRTGLWAS
jgi:lysozyme